jgi:hypothetical protein
VRLYLRLLWVAFATIALAGAGWTIMWVIGSGPTMQVAVAAGIASVVVPLGAVWAGRADTATNPATVDAAGRLPSSLAQTRAAPRSRLFWKVPARNPGFTGREDLLATLRTALLNDDRAVVQALHGIGGVGKTQLAVEYAHRFADSYDLVLWIASEKTELIGEQFASLAEGLGCLMPAGGADPRRIVSDELQTRSRWLLVFDNAEDPEYLAACMPSGAGHVLITSRTQRWTEIAVPIEVGGLTRAESIVLLKNRVPAIAAADANQLANALDDLPLAVTQAAAYMADTGATAREYIDALQAHAAKILDKGRPISYPRSLSAVIQLVSDELRRQDPAAADLATLCAFLAPEPIPAGWFPQAAAELNTPLSEQATDPLTWRPVLAHIGQYALARIETNTLQMHRLTQAILRSQQPPDQAALRRSLAETVLVANNPGSAQNPISWPRWAQILPHLLALDPETTSNAALRKLGAKAAWYLSKRGDPRAGRDLAERLYEQWRDRLGPDDPDTLQAAYSLAFAVGELGDNQTAHDLNQETFARRRRLLGENHPDTISSATTLACQLFMLDDIEAARDLDQETLERSRQILGHDHPQTLGLANNLASDLLSLRQPEAARDLDEETLQRRRRVLGKDHPDTLLSAVSLANDLRALGQYKQARKLDIDALARYRRILGEDHIDTLRCARSLAADMRALGQYKQARRLDEDAVARQHRVLGEDQPGSAPGSPMRGKSALRLRSWSLQLIRKRP